MQPAVVTFDCAGTLLRTDWNLVDFAVRCVRECGYPVDAREVAAYERNLAARWPEYEALNASRDHEATAEFWYGFTEEWKSETRREEIDTRGVLAHARDRLLDQFEVFEDVPAVLDGLQHRGIRVAIISNWDYTLERVLRAKGLHDRFEFALASLVEGVEKPHRKLFEIALDRLGVGAGSVWHIGDDPLDDLLGANGAGMKGILVDRDYRYPEHEGMRSLTTVLDMLEP